MNTTQMTESKRTAGSSNDSKRAAGPLMVLAAVLVAGLSACAPFAVTTPDGMIPLNEDAYSVYSYRATNPQGVVVSARQIRMRDGTDVPVAELGFWVDATKLRLRTTGAYALLGEDPIRSADGTEGVRLQFGRDDDGSVYRYDVVLFTTERFVHVVEAGGEEDLFAAASDSIELAIGSYVVKR